jgi:hypothetical protein
VPNTDSLESEMATGYIRTVTKMAMELKIMSMYELVGIAGSASIYIHRTTHSVAPT